MSETYATITVQFTKYEYDLLKSNSHFSEGQFAAWAKQTALTLCKLQNAQMEFAERLAELERCLGVKAIRP